MALGDDLPARRIGDGALSSADGSTAVVRLADNHTYRVVNLETGVSRNVTVPVETMFEPPPGVWERSDAQSVLGRFSVSVDGDRMAFEATVFYGRGAYRYVIDDPLPKAIRAAGGR